MMRRFGGCMIAMILSLLLRGDARAQESEQIVGVPTYIVNNILTELVLKDHMEYTLDLQNRTLAMYVRNEQDLLVKVKTLELAVDEYKVMTRRLQEINVITEKQLKDLYEQHRIDNRRSFFKGMFTGTVGTIVLAIVLILL